MYNEDFIYNRIEDIFEIERRAGSHDEYMISYMNIFNKPDHNYPIRLSDNISYLDCLGFGRCIEQLICEHPLFKSHN